MIEMNPRVSRSRRSPQNDGLPDREGGGEARRQLHAREIPNDLTKDARELRADARLRRRQVPRFAFEKFPGADALGTQMKSVGEAMGTAAPSPRPSSGFGCASSTRSRRLNNLRRHPRGVPWFGAAGPCAPRAVARHPPRQARQLGDDSIGAAWGHDGDDVRRTRYARHKPLPPRGLLRRRGRCRLELLLLDLRVEEDEALPPITKPRVVIIGSGEPDRPGDRVRLLLRPCRAGDRTLGYEAVMIAATRRRSRRTTTPPTASTSSRSRRRRCSPFSTVSSPRGVVTQFGGQTPLRLARHIEPPATRSWRRRSAIDLAEDASSSSALADELGIRAARRGPRSRCRAGAHRRCEIGYPVPSALLRARRRGCASVTRQAATPGDGGSLRLGARRPVRRERGRDRRRCAVRRETSTSPP